MFRTHLIHRPFVSNAMFCMMQQLLLCYQISQCPVSCMVGYCLYGTLLLCPHSACPVEIRVHHHIDVFSDINDEKIHFDLFLWFHFI